MINPHATTQPEQSNNAPDNSSPAETIDEDDICPICQLLLHNPVKTACNHTLCKSCMATWADVSLSAPMTIVSVDEEARCPMCRTPTSATIDDERAIDLRQKCPKTFAERQAEDMVDEEAREGIQTITVYIGNRHELVEPEAESPNMHQWTFFVKPSRREIIEEVQIFLHPTFQPSHIIRTRPPCEIRRLGWGTFSVVAGVILKAGFSWVSSDAEDSPDGAPKRMLRLEWTLDFAGFGGMGSMGRCRLKVKCDRGWEDVGEEERDEAEWARTLCGLKTADVTAASLALPPA
ncbi:hypothetical protein EJ03DRAFT_343333 [Teratosphaeria nubilosa]|uniref:Uncharacterized protein n=1 Tax=Teratosphaeria nubilosa TaxID=161662 RepID=A0A6G1LAA0_9PEZI|nr:hypothetical protein EJ03DRAFT_343333 [Teratosphaeria nubilosa]